MRMSAEIIAAVCSVDGCGKPARSRGLCRSHYDKSRHESDPEKAIARNAAWRAANSERALATARARYRRSHPTPVRVERLCSVADCGNPHYGKGLCKHHYDVALYAANPEKARAAAAVWKKAHPEEDRARTLAWREAHVERHRANNAAWHKAHPEKRKAVVVAYRKAHPDRVKETQRKRALTVGRQSHTGLTLAHGEWESILLSYGYQCAYCGKKSKRLTMDHVVPVSKGGQHVMANIVPACQPCNSRKGARPPLRPVSLVLL